MTLVARELRPLPGVRFQVAAPPLTDVLPRMDVAVLVGFAASGPLHVPVPVEDVAHFDAIFGVDAPLAWDQDKGETLYAYLAPAVRAFFKNGGLRAWIVRVADPATAAANVFPIPGLVEATASGRMIPAHAIARSPGSWSDPLLVNAQLFARPLRYVSSDVSAPAAPVVTAQLVSPLDVVAGDMLRLTYRAAPGGRVILMLVVASVASTALLSGLSTQFTGSSPRWFQTTTPAGVTDATSGSAVASGVAVTAQGLAAGTTDGAFSLVLKPAAPPAPGTVSAPVSPAPGTVIEVVFPSPAATLLLTVGTASPTDDASAVLVAGDGLWLAPPPSPALLTDASPLLERLSFRLTASDADGARFELDDLGFASSHPRAFWALPSDAELYEGPLSPLPPSAHEKARRASLADAGGPTAALVSEASNPRFPLAARSSAAAVLYPVGMPVAGGPLLGCSADEATSLRRDGLDLDGTSLSSLFLDPALAGALTTDLLDLANAVRYAGPSPRALLGVHAALDVEEATLVAAPDAGHAGWYRSDALPPAPAGAAPPPDPTPGGKFVACETPPPAPQGLRLPALPDGTGTYTLAWNAVTPPPSAAGEALSYVVRESPTPDFSDPAAVQVAVVPTPSWTAYARAPNDYFYWVAAQLATPSAPSGTTLGPWSAGLAVRVDAARYWVAAPPPPAPASDLLAVQRALLRTCCARGDLFAVLALPDGYREQDAASHAAALRTPAVQTAPGVPPIGSGEKQALAFGALYHPWLMGRDEGAIADVRRSPPDGAMAGVMARRSIDRGAWISPANVLLNGTVALTVPVPRSALSLLQDAQVNAIRPDPRGFLCLADDTLSLCANAPPVPINVRRLLSLLRRAALEVGAGYVFEPNDGRLARLVQRGFGGLLATLFQRGAFAGGTADQSYQLEVVTDTSSAADTDQGFFIVDIMVAPSVPLRFLTVRLVQTGDSGTITEPT